LEKIRLKLVRQDIRKRRWLDWQKRSVT